VLAVALVEVLAVALVEVLAVALVEVLAVALVVVLVVALEPGDHKNLNSGYQSTLNRFESGLGDSPGRCYQRLFQLLALFCGLWKNRMNHNA